MTKYNPANVVVLKREVIELSGEVHDLIEEKKLKEAEVAETDRILDGKRKSLKDFDNIVASFIQKIKAEEKEARAYLEEVKKEVVAHELSVSILHGHALSFELPEVTFTFAEDIAALLQKRIAGLDSSVKAQSEEKALLETYVDSLKTLVASLKAEKTQLEIDLEKLRKEILSGNDKNGKLGIQYLKMQEGMTNLRRRERDVLTMEKRLIPEHKALYSNRLCKKCGNPI